MLSTQLGLLHPDPLLLSHCMALVNLLDLVQDCGLAVLFPLKLRTIFSSGRYSLLLFHQGQGVHPSRGSLHF